MRLLNSSLERKQHQYEKELERCQNQENLFCQEYLADREKADFYWKEYLSDESSGTYAIRCHDLSRTYSEIADLALVHLLYFRKLTSFYAQKLHSLNLLVTKSLI